MPAPTQFTNLNIVTSIAGFFANQLTSSGWAVYWQSRGILSGIATIQPIRY